MCCRLSLFLSVTRPQQRAPSPGAAQSTGWRWCWPTWRLPAPWPTTEACITPTRRSSCRVSHRSHLGVERQSLLMLAGPPSTRLALSFRPNPHARFSIPISSSGAPPWLLFVFPVFHWITSSAVRGRPGWGCRDTEVMGRAP